MNRKRFVAYTVEARLNPGEPLRLSKVFQDDDEALEYAQARDAKGQKVIVRRWDGQMGYEAAPVIFTNIKRCLFERCGREADNGIICGYHWKRIPEPLQMEIRDAYHDFEAWAAVVEKPGTVPARFRRALENAEAIIMRKPI